MKILVTKRSKDNLAEVKFIKDMGESCTNEEAAEASIDLLDKAGRALKVRARQIKEKASRRS